MKTSKPVARGISRALSTPLTIAMMLLATAQQGWAGSDTWTGTTSSNWHTAGNWAGGSVPAGSSDIASFGTSTNTGVSIGQGTNISGINFNAGAGNFTIRQTTAVPMTFRDQGVINNSGVTQTFEIAPWLYLEKQAFLDFRGNATAGSKTKFVFAGAVDGVLIGGWSRFYDDASAGSAVFELNGANTDLGMGGRVNFYRSSTAGDATFWLLGNKGVGNDLESVAGTLISFHETTTAGNAVFNLGAGIDPLSRGSMLSFEGHSSAENATINVHPLPLGTGQTARVVFEANASAGNATIVLASIFGNDMPSTLDFLGAATGGTSTVWLRGINQLRIDGSAGVSIGSLEGDSASRVKLGSKKLTIGTNNKSTIMRGVLEGEGGSLEKTGTGMLTLSGTNTYTGSTSVSGGELRVTGRVAGNTTVGMGATLSGTGTLADVEVGFAAKIAPGAGVGTLRTGNLTLSPMAELKFDLVAPGGANDLIAIEGDLTLDGILDIGNPTGLADGRYTLFTYTGALTDNGLQIGNSDGDYLYTVDTSQANTVVLDVRRESAALGTSTSNLDFGVRVYNAEPTSRELTVQNDGNVPVSIADISLSGTHIGEFVVASDACSDSTLPVAASCSITLNHQGETAGVSTATLSIASDADGSPLAVALNARVVAAPVLGGLHGKVLEFQAGSGPLLIDADAALTFPGALTLATARLSVELISGVDPGGDLLSFLTTGVVSLSANSAGSNVLIDGVIIGTLVNPLSVGEELGVIFNGNATTARVQLLLQAITYQNINLSNPGAGLRELRVSVSYLGLQASATLSVNVVVVQSLSLSVVAMDFGTRAYNADPVSRILLVQNTGNVPVNLTETVITGTDASDFVVVDGCGVSALAVGAQCSMTINHGGNTPGERSAILRIQSDADGSPHELTLVVSVVGLPIVQNLGETTPSFFVGSAPLLLDANAQTLVSVPGAPTLEGARLRVNMLTGADADDDLLSFAVDGRVTRSGDEAGSDVLVDDVIVGELGSALITGEILDVVFNAGATPEHVQLVIQQLTYQYVNDVNPVPGVREIGVTLRYLGLEAAVTVAVNVQPAPSPPQPPSGGGNITTEVVNQTLNGTVQIGAGGVINGGNINGDVTGSGEVTGEIVMGAGATITGARITGNIKGSVLAPARVSGGTVTGNAVLSNVVIGSDVLLEPGLTLGEGVTFESPGLIDAVQSVDVFNSGGATVTQLSSGQITFSGDGYMAVSLPVAIVQAETGQAPGVYYGDNGDILLITADGLGIRAYARHADSASLQSLLSHMSLQITFTPLGQMLVASSGAGSDALQNGRQAMALQTESGYFSARPDVMAIPAHRGNGVGLLSYPVPGLGTVEHLSSLFVTSDGILMQQDLVPAPVDWLALKTAILNLPGVTVVSIDTRGIIQVNVDGISLRGVMDYAVARGGQAITGNIALVMAGYLSGNGMDDYRVTFGNGDKQVLYVYQLE